MQKYKSPTSLILLLIILCCSIVSSDAKDREKATVALVFVNNSKTTYDEEITGKINSGLHKKVDGLYSVVDGQPYLEKCEKAGIIDFSIAEKQDIIDAVGTNEIDYLIYAELQPFIRKEKITLFSYGKDMTATMILKMIDLPNKKYLYNGKFIVKASDSTSDWLIGNKSVALMAIDKTMIQVGEVISFRLPLEPATERQRN